MRALEHGSSLSLLPGLFDAAFVGSKTTVPLVVNAGTLADSQDQLLAEVVLASLLRVDPLVALREERVGVAKSLNPSGLSSSTVRSARGDQAPGPG